MKTQFVITTRIGKRKQYITHEAVSNQYAQKRNIVGYAPTSKEAKVFESDTDAAAYRDAIINPFGRAFYIEILN